MFAGLGTSTWSVELFIDSITKSYLGRLLRDDLSQLHLENMNLTELPAGVFDGLEDLRKLHLQGNRLRTLPKNVFRNLRGLRYLYLQNNGLEELPSSACAETM